MEKEGRKTTLVLGLDIGTSKVALALTEAGTRSVLHTQSMEYPGSATRVRGEQDANALLATAAQLVQSALRGRSEKVSAICVAGQMHGVVVFDGHGTPLTPLINWQDERCNAEPSFLPGLCARTGHSLCSGFGCATLSWLYSHGVLPAEGGRAETCRCGTVMDLLVARLCGIAAAPVMDETNAAAFGLYSHAAHDWDRAAVCAAGISPDILPRVVLPGAIAGLLTQESAEALLCCCPNIPAGIPVHAAAGDFQAALLTTVRDAEADIAINIGTGGQLAVVVDSVPSASPLADVPLRVAGRPYEYRPFFGGRLAVTAASLSGGSAWKWLVDLLQSWLGDLGLSKERDALYSALDALGLKALDELAKTAPSSMLNVHPTFSGERHAPELRGEITGITTDNMGLGQLSAALAKGIVENLQSMVPEEVLRGKKRVVASGNAIRRSKLFQTVIQRTFMLPLEISEFTEEAAVGASFVSDCEL